MLHAVRRAYSAANVNVFHTVCMHACMHAHSEKKLHFSSLRGRVHGEGDSLLAVSGQLMLTLKINERGNIARNVVLHRQSILFNSKFDVHTFEIRIFTPTI